MEKLLDHFRRGSKEVFAGQKEISADTFLNRLEDDEKINVMNWVNMGRRLSKDPKNRYAILGVGSIAHNPESINHTPRDIDLRFLHDSPAGSVKRKAALYDLQRAILDMLETKRQRDYFDIEDFIIEKPQGDRYWFNQDPSFKIIHSEGRPIHLTYPGAEVSSAQRYIEIERGNNESFAVLFDPTGNITPTHYPVQ